MAKSKLVTANEKIAEKVVGTYKNIEDTVVSGYTLSLIHISEPTRH